MGTFLAAPGNTAAQAPLDCSFTVEEVVGAHAGSLSIRVGATVTCDRPAALAFTLPGGTLSEFSTEQTNTFFGVIGDAYVCFDHPAWVSLLARGADGTTWVGQAQITGVETAPACDFLLRPGLNFVTWPGQATEVGAAFDSSRFGLPLSFSDNLSEDGRDHILAVWFFEPALYQTTGGRWRVWSPRLPAQLADLSLLAPGATYMVRTDAEVPWFIPGTPPGQIAATTVIDFLPQPPSAEAVEGSCFSLSLSLPARADAYRCAAGNQILDPCFALQDGTVVCGADPTTGAAGFPLTLTEPLPARETGFEPPANQVWLMQLADGAVCGYLTGATAGTATERINYGCNDGTSILGDPRPGSPWTATAVVGHVGPDGFVLESSAEVQIATVWR